jgi:predicted enzyme related to lactoylglutathione lyase
VIPSAALRIAREIGVLITLAREPGGSVTGRGRRRPGVSDRSSGYFARSACYQAGDQTDQEWRSAGQQPAGSLTGVDITVHPDLQGANMTDSSTEGIKIVLHPVTDLEKAKAVYTALLGLPPQADSSYYVGYDAAGQHIGLVPGGGPQGMTSPVAYWQVPDIEAKLAEVTAAGASLKDPVRDVGGGRLVATFTDPDGNVLGLLQDPVS